MKTPRGSFTDRELLVAQLMFLSTFYIFAIGVISFFAYSIYRSLVNHDVVGHTVIISSLIGSAFLILVFVVTMVCTVLIKEGRKKVSDRGGVANEKEIDHTS
jgi:predicted PurR-regulated permease PerM